MNWYIKNSALILIALLPLVGHGQSDLFQLWPDTALAKANSAREVMYMSDEEKQVVFYINVCRMNPPLFEDTYLTDYLKSNKVKKDKDVKSLIEELKNTSPRVLLQPSEILTETARHHALDMGESGRTGHNASDGTSFTERVKDVSKEFSVINENANYGNDKALDIVVDLLIDKNAPNAGHRKNILDIESRYIGVAIEPHKRYRFNCVQDFGGAKQD